MVLHHIHLPVRNLYRRNGNISFVACVVDRKSHMALAVEVVVNLTLLRVANALSTIVSVLKLA